MGGDALTFLLEGGIQDSRISKNGLVISIDIGWTNNRDSHHPEFIPETPYVFVALLHCNELQTKRQ